MRRINAKKKRKHTTKTKYRIRCVCKCEDSAIHKHIPVVRTTKRISLRSRRTLFLIYTYITVKYKKVKEFSRVHFK